MDINSFSKRIVSFILAFLLLFTSVPSFSLVVEAEEVSGEEVEDIDEKDDLVVVDDEELTEEDIDLSDEEDGEDIGEVVESNDREVLSKEVVENKTLTYDNLDELIAEAVGWTEENNSKYKFNTVATLVLSEVNKEDIINKRNQYQSGFGYGAQPKNIISSYVLGLEAIEGYLEKVKDYDLSKEINSPSDAEATINTVIALDLLGENYNKEIAVETIVKGINSGKINDEYLGQAIISIGDKVDKEEKEELRNLIISKKSTDNLIGGNLENHALAMEGLIALGEDINSEEFQELFQVVLGCKRDGGYSRTPSNEWKFNGVEAQVLELYQAIKNQEDIYKTISKKDIEKSNYSIEINKSKKEFYENEEIKLSVVVKDGEREVSLPYTFTSLNEDIVKVKDNKFEIVGLGKVGLEVKLNNFSNVSDEIEIEILEIKTIEDINKHIDNTLGYYEKFRVKDYSSELDYEDYTVLAKTDMDLSKWKNSEDIDKNLELLASKAQQVELYLSLGKDPRDYKGRNLIEEIKIELEKGIKEEKFSQNYLDGVNAFNRFHQIFDLEIEEEIKGTIAENLLYARAYDGGFGGGPKDKTSAVSNTGRGLRALSLYRDIKGVDEAIESSITYLKSVQKENGRIYDKSDFTHNHTDAVRGLLAVGENLTKDEWKKEGQGPIEGMFLYKRENNSFGQKEAPSLGSDKIATRNVLDTLLTLEELGYGKYELGGKEIEANPGGTTEGKVVKDYINAVVGYYDDIHFVENQSTLNPREYGTLNRLNLDLAKWTKLEKTAPSYDRELKYIGNKSNQVEVYLEIGKDPTNYSGRNLVEEMVEQIEEGIEVHSYRSYLKAVVVLNKYNLSYPEKYIELDNQLIVENILAMQNEDGGFKQVEDGKFDEESKGYSVVDNTGLALEALSNYSGEKVYKSIQKAIEFLQAIQKEDGGFYLDTFLTIPHGQAIKGLLAVEEDLRTEKWKKENNGPIEALFINWQDNNSFWNMAGESENNKPWIEATERALSTLVDLSEKGYSSYILDSIPIHDKEELVPEFLKVETMVARKDKDGYDKIYNPREVEIDTSKHGELTALGALRATTALIEEDGGFVTSIGGIEGKGKDSGWIYTVNDKVLDVGANQAELKEGDRVVWFYALAEDNWQVPSWLEITDGIKIDLDYKSEFEVGEEIEIKFEIRDKDGEKIEDTITITTEDKNIEIKDNKILGLEEGSASIDISFNKLNVKRTLWLTVKEKSEGQEISDLETVLRELREVIGTKNSFSFRKAIGYNYTSQNLDKDLETINRKLEIRENDSTGNVAGNIIGIISAGSNPYNYKEINYVDILLKSKNSNNKYIIGKRDDYSTSQAFAIIALEMAGADYDKDGGRNMLLSYQAEDGGFGGTDETGMVLTALGLLEKDAKLNNSIDLAKKYLREAQLENGGFKSVWDKTNDTNIYSTSAVVQGLVAIGEDVSTWKKGNNSPITALIKEYKISYGTSSETDDVGNEQVFLALGDVSKGKSMFKEIEYKRENPARIEIQDFKLDRLEVGMKLPLEGKVYDENNNQLFGYEIEWSVGNGEAKIEDNIIEFLEEGEITIRAKVKGFEISEEKKITILPKRFEIEIVEKTEIVNGKEARVEAKIKNNIDKEEDALFIIGLYDEDNRLVNYSYSEKKIKSGGEETLGGGFKVPKTGKYTIKIFVWDSFDNQNIRLEKPTVIKTK